MKVIVDSSRCDAHGDCVMAAPDVFALDEDHVVLLLDPTPGEEQRSCVEDAVRRCPVQAISIDD
ncbi:ferredoxin [Conexibacter sp. SYSU D00693]|uniref:ferredoxin n=1 Tax=Conexibacter sp. SYSU D00693 TaxID=2812560 RepID=UPI00196A1EFD|nr:ferredoxin [Conexibacter sp. SYSU D00693]